ncbi:alpha/beta hydrolase [Thalassolituus oleivorans]|uniref:alpha/beta hydrolase n=1 Tax=Thalassolituus oleivorans TaxID=187493 RepID=UPI00240A7B04|nr:alpha/beta fold hydrolase [Thalassolituus oleivorans]MDF1641701.1 alpha/beta fold hydrolase [Thalassolituus oleivorans]
MSDEFLVDIRTNTGVLEARSLNLDHDWGVLMCHPHPLFGGTMDNKVVTTVVRAARDAGLNTLRFNFRGVGKSTGVHDDGQGEQDDVLAALKYAKEELGWTNVILAGFSFGAGMACLAAVNKPEWVNGLVLMAPAVHHFDAPMMLPHDFETWVLMGDADEIVPFREVDDWVSRVIPAPHFQIFTDGSHFFHGRLTALKQSFLTIIAELIA